MHSKRVLLWLLGLTEVLAIVKRQIVKIYPMEEPAIIIEVFALPDSNYEIVVQYQDGETVSYMKDELEEKGRIERG